MLFYYARACLVVSVVVSVPSFRFMAFHLRNTSSFSTICSLSDSFLFLLCCFFMCVLVWLFLLLFQFTVKIPDFSLPERFHLLSSFHVSHFRRFTLSCAYSCCYFQFSLGSWQFRFTFFLFPERFTALLLLDRALTLSIFLFLTTLFRSVCILVAISSFPLAVSSSDSRFFQFRERFIALLLHARVLTFFNIFYSRHCFIGRVFLLLF